jgi:RNA polymerase sigma factor (sigma-70 family)
MPGKAEGELDRFRQGDVGAFEAIFRAHQGAVYRWILRIVRNAATAEELTVETFWRVYRAHARFDPARGFAPWARRIATHAALDWLRAQRNEPEPAGGRIERFPEEFPAAASADPAVSAETREKIAQAFARLPPKLRVAAVLAVVEEEPHKEIAAALGISVAAVKVRVFRALRLLRKNLDEQGVKP